MKITDYEKVQSLDTSNIFIIDGDNGTKTIFSSDLAKSLIALLSSQDFISGVNLSELDQINGLSSGDKLLVGTASGNKAIGTNDALFALLDAFAPPETHRTVFRGKNLGNVFTVEQKARVQDGTFKGLFLGDYWVIGGQNWRIADFDYWYNCGDSAFTNHHLVIMPDNALYNAQMNAENVTTGGYVGSLMYTANLENAKTIINSAFGNAVLTHRDLLVNAVSNGYPSGHAWYDSSVELPNEIMMYGHHVFTAAATGSVIPYLHTINKTQLALFQAHPKFIFGRSYNTWLRDVVSAAYFADVNGGGDAAYYGASPSLGVRPVFPVG
jgi:hypothetical protein